MIDVTSLSIFITASLALLLVPGPAVLYIVARSVNQGRMAGIVSVFGIGLGSTVHVLAAAVGLSALLMSSALIFSIVKYLGAAYLIVLGIRTLFTGSEAKPDVSKPESLRHIFSQGVVVNVLNPKVALFFFAYLPQFVDPARGSVVVQISLLGTIFVTMAICTDSTYALLAGTVGQWLRGSQGCWRVQRFLAGGTYILLGVATAVSGSDNQ